VTGNVFAVWLACVTTTRPAGAGSAGVRSLVVEADTVRVVADLPDAHGDEVRAGAW
jgi:hypothetical protein